MIASPVASKTEEHRYQIAWRRVESKWRVYLEVWKSKSRDKPPANRTVTNTIMQETSPLLVGMNFADSRLIYPRGRKGGEKEEKKKTRLLANDPVRLSSSLRP